MRTEVWRGQNSLKFIYFRYKDSPYFSLLILSISILVCFLLIFQAVIPQVQDWFSISDEVTAVRQKIAILRGNTIFMSGLNKERLENNRQLVILALPADKDFGWIINAVAISAVKSGTSINDFTFSLGLISSSSAKPANDTEVNESITKLMLTLNGDIDGIKSFITEIYEKLPISQIESVESNGDSASISLIFYNKFYKPLRISESEPIHPLSQENNSILSKLSQWDASSSYDNQETQFPPSSAVPLF